MIKEYINSKDNKKYYEVKNEYLGKNIYTGKEKRISKKGFRTKREAQNYIVKAKKVKILPLAMYINFGMNNTKHK